MSANGLDVFDKTLQTTHGWLNDVMEAVGPDRRVAWKVLSTVLHKLRDRLTVELAAHLGAELPLLVRGVYYDQFEPAKQPTRCRDMQEFTAEVAEWLSDTRPVNPRVAVDAVFATLSRRIPAGQIRKVQDALPQDIREAWIAIEEGIVPVPERLAEAAELGTDELFSDETAGLQRGDSSGTAAFPR
jgi:uncharacterized protein (DUF2267 family)